MARQLCGAIPLSGVLTVAVMSPMLARAQGPADAALRGRVTLPGGAPAAGAQFSLWSAEGIPVRRLVLGSDGRFLLLRLQPGDYELRAYLPGFERVLTEPISVISLAGGDLSEVALEFRERAPSPLPQAPPGARFVNLARVEPAAQVGTPGTGLANVAPQASLQADASAINQLPLLSRDWQGTTALDSTAADATASTPPDADSEAVSEPEPARAAAEADSPGAGLSYGGLSATQNSFRQDGLSAEQGFRSGPRGAALGGPRASATFGQSALRSLRVMPSTFSAQRGSAGGAVLSFGSQRGGARLHGSAFAFTRQSAWAAVNPYSLVQHYSSGLLSNALLRPHDGQEQFGGSVGLPLASLHLPSFGGGRNAAAGVFASLEYQQRHFTTESSPSSPGFYALTPTQVALLGTRGVTRAATQSALNYLDSLSGPIARSDKRLLGFARLDTPLGSRDEVGVAVQSNRFDAPAGAQLSGASAAVLARGRGSLGDTTFTISAFSGHWLHTFGRSFSHDLRGQWAHDLEYETPRAPLPNEPAIGPGGLAPQVSIAAGGFTYGTPASLGRSAYPDEHRIELADSFLFLRGSAPVYRRRGLEPPRRPHCFARQRIGNLCV